MRLEGLFNLTIIQPDGMRHHVLQRNLITTLGKTAIGQLASGLGTYSPMTHLVFGSDPTQPAYTDAALGAESWAVDCQGGGQRVVEISDSLRGFSITLKRIAAVTYGGASFQMAEMGVAGRLGGKTALLFSRTVAVSPVTIATGTLMIPTWTLRFREEEEE